MEKFVDGGFAPIHKFSCLVSEALGSSNKPLYLFGIGDLGTSDSVAFDVRLWWRDISPGVLLLLLGTAYDYYIFYVTRVPV